MPISGFQGGFQGTVPLGAQRRRPGLFGPAQGPAGGGLEDQRNRAFGTLQEGLAPWAGQLGQATEQSLLSGVQGGGVPYTDAVRGLMLGRQADQAAATRNTEQQQARRMFAANGMEGGGGELAAMRQSERGYSSRMQQARGEIDLTAELENFKAQERARTEAASFMASRAAAEAPYRLKEADLRSRFEEVGSSQAPAAPGAAMPGGMPVLGAGEGMDEQEEPYTPTWQPPTPRMPAQGPPQTGPKTPGAQQGRGVLGGPGSRPVPSPRSTGASTARKPTPVNPVTRAPRPNLFGPKASAPKARY